MDPIVKIVKIFNILCHLARPRSLSVAIGPYVIFEEGWCDIVCCCCV